MAVFYLILVPFFVLTGILLVGEVTKKMPLRYIAMVSLMPLLIVFYVMSIPLGKVDWLIIVALICGYAGDIFLMFDKDELFIFGLGSFLLGHIFYIISFLLSIGNLANFPAWTLVLLIPSIGMALLALKKTQGKLGDEQIGVYVYLCAILTMVTCSILRFAEFDMTTAFIVYLGATLFVISDGMIAINEFDETFPLAAFFIKITYVLAQFFIIYGVILGTM